MRTVPVSFGCALLLLMCSIASFAQTIQTDYDRSFPLANLKTYEFSQQQRKPGDPLAASPLNDRRIREALDSQLRLNGFTNNPSGQPDFKIAYFVSTRAGLDIQDNRFGFLHAREASMSTR